MTTIEKLRERIVLAKKATPGPWDHGGSTAGEHWVWERTHHAVGDPDAPDTRLCCASPNNAAHIAANDPETVIKDCEEHIAALEEVSAKEEYLHECNRLLGEAGHHVLQGPSDGISSLANERDELKEELRAARAEIERLKVTKKHYESFCKNCGNNALDCACK